jgi:hypothetical protein
MAENMTDKSQPPNDTESLQGIFDPLLPSNENMDYASALIILERAGEDPASICQAVKSSLENKLREMQAQKQEVPESLLRAIASL